MFQMLPQQLQQCRIEVTRLFPLDITGRTKNHYNSYTIAVDILRKKNTTGEGSQKKRSCTHNTRLRKISQIKVI